MQTILRWCPDHISPSEKPPANSDGEGWLEGKLDYVPVDGTTLKFRRKHELAEQDFPTGRFKVAHGDSDTEVLADQFVLYLKFLPELHDSAEEEGAIADLLMSDYGWKWAYNTVG